MARKLVESIKLDTSKILDTLTSLVQDYIEDDIDSMEISSTLKNANSFIFMGRGTFLPRSSSKVGRFTFIWDLSTGDIRLNHVWIGTVRVG